MRDAQADKEYLKKLEHTLRQITKSIPVYVFSDVPRLAIQPFRQAHFSELGLFITRPLSDGYIQANAIVKKLVEQIPNAHWVDLAPALASFEHSSAYAGKPTYFDDHHLNVYGATILGELFIKSDSRILTK